MFEAEMKVTGAESQRNVSLVGRICCPAVSYNYLRMMAGVGMEKKTLT